MCFVFIFVLFCFTPSGSSGVGREKVNTGLHHPSILGDVTEVEHAYNRAEGMGRGRVVVDVTKSSFMITDKQVVAGRRGTGVRLPVLCLGFDAGYMICQVAQFPFVLVTSLQNWNNKNKCLSHWLAVKDNLVNT